VTPDPVADPTAGWLPSAFGPTARVYQDVTSLWLTARALASAGMIDAPSGLRPLVEAVYGGAARRNLPQGIVMASNIAKQMADVDRGIAIGRLLPLQNGYAPAQMWEDDDGAQTRLSEPTRTWRLASIVNGRLLPWASLWTEERDYRRLWAFRKWECAPINWMSRTLLVRINTMSMQNWRDGSHGSASSTGSFCCDKAALGSG